jgi:hypothetical protein
VVKKRAASPTGYSHAITTETSFAKRGTDFSRRVYIIRSKRFSYGWVSLLHFHTETSVGVRFRALGWNL